VSPPDTGDETVSNVTITISKSKHAPIRFNGEETMGLKGAGSYEALFQARAEEAIRKLVNTIEADLYIEGKKFASRAFGTAATTPFATAVDLTDLAEVALILDDNGCPTADRQIVLNNAAISKLRGKQSGLFKVNEAGSSDMLRNGVTDRLEGFAVRQSGQVSSVTKGTGASYLVNLGAGYAVGATSIAIDTGSGTVLAGDFVTFAGDANKYVVKTGVAAAGSIVLQEPGLQATLADDVAMTVGGTTKSIVAFDRAALCLLTRLPAMPDGGDEGEHATIIDPLTGIAFEFSQYGGYRLRHWEIGLAWGVGGVKGAHIASLLA
jgi:hypothetical protein